MTLELDKPHNTLIFNKERYPLSMSQFTTLEYYIAFSPIKAIEYAIQLINNLRRI